MASGKSGRSAPAGSGPTKKGSRTRGGAEKGRPQGRRQAGRPQRGNPVGKARKPAVRQREIPWLLIGAITVVVLLAVGVIGFALFRNSEVAAFRPGEDNRDPSLQIPGVVTVPYAAQQHVNADQRVAYDKAPPFGGPHDQYWAACSGVVYPSPVRSENMVHSLEHGAVWITYDPARISGPAVATLAGKVEGQDYTMMSPFPGLAQPISLQSWGHQLELSDPNDPRIDQFISSLRQNQYTYPEVGARCDALGPGYFDQDNPPPFDAGPVPPNAVTMDGRGAQVTPG
jgi:hypothetical protein